MSLALVVNGVTYNYPEVDDVDWGPDATDWASAVTTGMLQKAGGLFQLLAEVDFGTSFGLKSLYYKSRTTNPADAGQMRLARADVINWRNQANSGNLSLGVNSSNVLTFNGSSIQNTLAVTDTTTIDLTLSSDTLSADIVSASITNSLISASAAIAYSKLNLSASIVNADISASAAIAYSKLSLTGAIVNADISASAAIAYSKLALTGTIVNADISVSAAIAYSKLALTGTIVNADINASAAIAYSKLALTGSIVNADINASAAIAYSKLALTGSIVNADINASAAIAFSKLAALSSANILVGSAGNVASSVAMSGDITIDNTGATAIGANKVTNSQLATMAQSTIKGRAAGAGTGNPVDLTATQATAILDVMVGDSGSGGTKGLVPAPAAGDATAGKFLKADGTWIAPSGAGDVVGPAGATDSGFARFDGTTGKLLKNSAATISNADVASNAAIAYSKLAALASANILVGNVSNVAAVVAVTGDISLSNTGVTAYSGTVPLNKGGTGQVTKAAAFDALSPMSAGGDIIYGGTSGTGTRLAKGTDGQILGLASGVPAWTNRGVLAVSAKTTTYSITTADAIILCSAGPYTVTLPTAVGITGQQFIIEKTDAPLGNIITVATTSSQTIGAGGGTSIALYSQGESITVYSDGANWQMTRNIPQIVTSYTPTFSAGWGTPSNITIFYQRQGSDVRVFGSFTSGNTAASAGTISLPSGVTAKTFSSASTYIYAGELLYGSGATFQRNVLGYASGGTSVSLIVPGNPAFAQVNVSTPIGNAFSCALDIVVSVAGWS